MSLEYLNTGSIYDRVELAAIRLPSISIQDEVRSSPVPPNSKKSTAYA